MYLHIDIVHGFNYTQHALHSQWTPETMAAAAAIM